MLGSLVGPDGPGTISIGQVSADRIRFQATVHIDFDHNSDADDVILYKVDLNRP
jgi:hypothetical protein